MQRRYWPTASRLGVGFSVVLALGGCAAQRPAAGHVGAASGSVTAPSTWRTLGQSVEGRAIESVTVGRGPRRCLIVGSIHGDESEGLEAIDEAIDVARRHDDAWTTTIIRDLNPDGTARRTRRNARGVDLNRNWPASNFRGSKARGSSALSEPETAVAFDLIESMRPTLVLVLHAAANGPFVNFDGPASAEAERFAEAASSAGRPWRVEPSMGYPTPGSLGSMLGVDRSVAILTIEFRRGDRTNAGEALRRGLDAVLRR